MSTIGFDTEDNDLLGEVNFSFEPLTDVELSELDPAEAARINRSRDVAERYLYNDIPTDDAIPPGRISPVPAVAEKVVEATTGATNLVPPAQTIDVDAIHDYIDEINVQKNLIENHPEIPLPFIPELAGMPEEEQRSFLVQYAALVGELLELLTKLGDRDRKKNDHMKNQYDTLNREVGDAIGKRGTANFWSNLLGFGVRAAGLAIGGYLENEYIKTGSDFLGQQIPNFMGLYTSGLDSRQSMASSRLNMINTQMAETSQKGGDNSAWKNEILQNLNDIKQWMSAAVRQG